MKYLFFSLCVFFGLSAAYFFVPFAHADTDPCSADIAGETHAQLQSDLDACNAEIAQWTTILDSTKANTASYQTEVTELNAKINAAEANIKAKDVAIANLGQDIDQAQGQITTLQGELNADTGSIGELIRKTNEVDSFTLADAMLSDQSLSDFLSDATRIPPRRILWKRLKTTCAE